MLNQRKTICFVHYGIGWKDGINTVIKTLAGNIKKQEPSVRLCFLGGEIKREILDSASYKTIPQLLPRRIKPTKRQVKKRSLAIAEKLAKETKGMSVVIIENPFLGTYHLPAMAGFSIYARKYKPARTKVFFRIHDLYIDAPQYSKDLQKYLSSQELKEIARGEGVDGFLIVNRALGKKLVKEGVPREKIFYLPNGINEKIFKNPVKKKSGLVQEALGVSAKTKLLVYPVRVVPRKNIEEAVLLTYFIREITEDNYGLVVSGKIDKNDPLSRDYYKRLEKLVEIAQFPIVFTKGAFSLERECDSKGEIKKLGIGDLYHNSQAIIMTSLREGFGYPFLECWFAKKIVIGRRIEEVVNDFEKSGFDFKWLYRCFSVQGKDLPRLKSEEHFKGIKKAIEIFKNPGLKKQVFKENKANIMKQIKLLRDKDLQKRIVKVNLEAAKKTYGISGITKRFLELIDLK